MNREELNRKLLEVHPFAERCTVCNDLTLSKLDYRFRKGRLQVCSYDEDSLPFSILVNLARKHSSVTTIPVCKQCFLDIVMDGLDQEMEL